MRSDRGRLHGLYAITAEGLDTESLVARVAECIAGGAALVQYRAKRAGSANALVQARAVAAACRAGGATFIVNDSVPLASAVQADGVHLGRDDATVREARIVLPKALIGVSCYADPERASAAARDGADYVAVGSMFPSTTKPGAVHAPLAAIRLAREASGLPVAAIGGITAQNAAQVVDAGADMIAVISALFDASDLRASAAALSRLFEPAEGTNDVRTQPRPL